MALFKFLLKIKGFFHKPTQSVLGNCSTVKMVPGINSYVFFLGVIIGSQGFLPITSAYIIVLPLMMPNATVFNSWWKSSPDFGIADLPSEIGHPHLPGSGIWYLNSSASSNTSINFRLTFDLNNPNISPCFLANTVIKIEYSSHLAPTSLWPVWGEDYASLVGARDDERWITIARTIDMTKSNQVEFICFIPPRKLSRLVDSYQIGLTFQIEITGLVQPGGYFVFNNILLEFIIDESDGNCDESSTETPTTETPSKSTKIGFNSFKFFGNIGQLNFR